jgi:hypothetical protein
MEQGGLQGDESSDSSSGVDPDTELLSAFKQTVGLAGKRRAEKLGKAEAIVSSFVIDESAASGLELMKVAQEWMQIDPKAGAVFQLDREPELAAVFTKRESEYLALRKNLVESLNLAGEFSGTGFAADPTSEVWDLNGL